MLYTSNLVVGLETGLNNPDFLLKVADETNTGVEFFLHTGDCDYVRKAEMIPDWLGNRPLTTHGPFRGVEAASAEGTAEHIHMLAAYRTAFVLAKRLGSQHLVVHTHQRVIDPDEKLHRQQMCQLSIRELLTMGSAYGVGLLIENLGIQKQGVSLYDENEFLELLDAFPQAGCLIDAGHLNVAGWDAERLLRCLGPRVVGYHFHNNDGKTDSHCRILDGTLDYEHLMSLYRRYTPQADITLEYSDDHGIKPPDVIEDIRYLKAML